MPLRASSPTGPRAERGAAQKVCGLLGPGGRSQQQASQALSVWSGSQKGSSVLTREQVTGAGPPTFHSSIYGEHAFASTEGDSKHPMMTKRRALACEEPRCDSCNSEWRVRSEREGLPDIPGGCSSPAPARVRGIVQVCSASSWRPVGQGTGEKGSDGGESFQCAVLTQFTL